jgi:hypothetical protein
VPPGLGLGDGEPVGLGLGETVGDGEPVGEPVGDGEGEPVGEPVGDGEPLGEPVGLGDGEPLVAPKTPDNTAVLPLVTTIGIPLFIFGTGCPLSVRSSRTPLPEELTVNCPTGELLTATFKIVPDGKPV